MEAEDHMKHCHSESNRCASRRPTHRPTGYVAKALVVALIGTLSLPAIAGPEAMDLKDLPDDARAAISKELARKNRQAESTDVVDQPDPSQGGKGRGRQSCTMDIASQDKPSPASRRVIAVITGPLVQICK